MITLLDENFSQLNTFLKDLKPSQLFILVDENTHNHCLPTFLGNLETDIPFEIIEIEAGEELKTIETATQLWGILSEFEADRKSLLINLGGGVITDLGGFVASTYKRGVKFINVPTSLLGMCDASIGGKTGVDLGFLKNIVGTFTQPEQVFVFPKFLKTLPHIELRSGFAEMLKHGLIADEKHWKDLTSIDELSVETVEPLIECSMNIKQNVVAQDFKEQNIRKILNFGHTIGHAVEGLFLKSGNLVPHGECVAMGMVCETYISFLENLIDEKTATDIMVNFQKFYPKLDISAFSNEEILMLMLNDKKNSDQNINFTLIDGIGHSIFNRHCRLEHINSALEKYRSL